MPQIFITSDLHLGHDKPFIWLERGFSCIEEHDNTILKLWNETVSPDYTVYLLGDVMLNDTDTGMKYLEKLNGIIHIVRGNHDTDRKMLLYTESPNVAETAAALYLRKGKYTFYLSHYPTLIDNTRDPENKPLFINLYGHTHQKDNFFTLNGKEIPFMYHVGVDSHDMCPVLLDDIIEDINLKRSASGSK